MRNHGAAVFDFVRNQVVQVLQVGATAQVGMAVIRSTDDGAHWTEPRLLTELGADIAQRVSPGAGLQLGPRGQWVRSHSRGHFAYKALNNKDTFRLILCFLYCFLCKCLLCRRVGWSSWRRSPPMSATLCSIPTMEGSASRRAAPWWNIPGCNGKGFI